jgi:hypothetical protein
VTNEESPECSLCIDLFDTPYHIYPATLGECPCPKCGRCACANKYGNLDDEFDFAPAKGRGAHQRNIPDLRKSKPVNTRMAFLNRQAGIINRYRNRGIL